MLFGGRDIDDEFISHGRAVVLSLAEYQNRSPEQLGQKLEMELECWYF